MAENCLLTKNVMRHYNYVYKQVLNKRKMKSSSISEISMLVVDKIKDIWSITSIPIILDKRIADIIQVDHDVLNGLKKSYNKDTKKLAFINIEGTGK